MQDLMKNVIRKMIYFEVSNNQMHYFTINIPSLDGGSEVLGRVM